MTGTLSAEAFNAELPQYMRDFAVGQVLANLSYENLTGTACLRILEPNGSWRRYTSHQVSGLPKGLHSYILSPIEAVPNAPYPIKVAFRGTYCEFFWNYALKVEWNFAALKRDIDIYGPGLQSFWRNSETILSAFEQEIADQKDVELLIAGHSLGALDSIYFLYHVIDGNLKSGRFSNVRNITIDLFNSPGGSATFKKMLHALLEKNAKSPNPIKITFNIGLSDGDPIPGFWKPLLTGISPEVASIHLVKTDKINNNADFPNELYKTSYELYEYMIAHQISGNFFAPQSDMGRISTNMRHTYDYNGTRTGQRHIDKMLSETAAWLATIVTGVNGFFTWTTSYLWGAPFQINELRVSQDIDDSESAATAGLYSKLAGTMRLCVASLSPWPVDEVIASPPEAYVAQYDQVRQPVNNELSDTVTLSSVSAPKQS